MGEDGPVVDFDEELAILVDDEYGSVAMESVMEVLSSS